MKKIIVSVIIIVSATFGMFLGIAMEKGLTPECECEECIEIVEEPVAVLPVRNDTICPECSECPECQSYESELEQCQSALMDTIPFFLTTYKVAFGNEYVRGEYDCSEFARDYVKEMAEIGIMASRIHGNSPSEGSHAWACLWVEPQSGQFISPDEGYDLHNIQK